MSNSLQHHGLYSPWNSLGLNTGVGSLPLLQGIFPTQELNPCLPHCRQFLYQLSHKGKPKNTGAGSLTLLQRIFLIQELNLGLLHFRQILHQLSYQGSTKEVIRLNKIFRMGPNRTSVLISGRDNRGTYSQRKDCVWTQQEDCHLQTKKRGLRRN